MPSPACQSVEIIWNPPPPQLAGWYCCGREFGCCSCSSVDPERFRRQPEKAGALRRRRGRPCPQSQVSGTVEVIPPLAEIHRRLQLRRYAVLAGRVVDADALEPDDGNGDRKSTRLNSSHRCISYA